MSMDKRVTRIEDHLKRKQEAEDPIRSLSFVDLAIHIRRHLENGDEGALKKYPPMAVEAMRRVFLEKAHG